MNLPGKNHVIDLREDSRVDIVETFLTRKFSYFANVNDIKEGARPCWKATRKIATDGHVTVDRTELVHKFSRTRGNLLAGPCYLNKPFPPSDHQMRPDSSSSSVTLPPLDYLQPSPVRGQLEPHDELTRKSGWRFLQCTDTPNELKVRDNLCDFPLLISFVAKRCYYLLGPPRYILSF